MLSEMESCNLQNFSFFMTAMPSLLGVYIIASNNKYFDLAQLRLSIKYLFGAVLVWVILVVAA